MHAVIINLSIFINQMAGKINQELVERIVSLGKDQAIEIAKSILDYYKVNLKGTEYIDELLEIGMDYDRLGEPEKALNCYLKAEKRALAIGDSYGLGTIYSNIGVIYNAAKDFDQALNYYEKALKLVETIENQQEIGILYNNIGYVYKNILKYAESIEYYLKSLKYLRNSNDKFSMTASYYNLAEVFAKLEDYDSAIEYINECIKIDQELGLSTLNSDLKYRESLIARQKRHAFKEGSVKESIHTEVKASENSKPEQEEKKGGLRWLWKKKN